MEEAIGTQLGMIWDELSPDTKLSIMREVVSIESKMLSVSFSQYAYCHSQPWVQNLIIFASAMAAYIMRVTQSRVQSQPASPAKLPQNSKSMYTRRSA